MKESKLIELKNKVDRLGKVVQALINEVQANATLVQGTLTAFQLHIGKDEWEKVVAELKEREERRTKEEKILMWARLINTDRVSENFMYKGQQTLWTGLTDGDKRNQEKCNIEKRLIRCIQFHDGGLAYSDMGIQFEDIFVLPFNNCD